MSIEKPNDEQIKAVNEGKPVTIDGSKDGTGAADHDLPYVFGRKPHTLAPFPFTPREYAKLLLARGNAQEKATGKDHPNLGRFRIKDK